MPSKRWLGVSRNELERRLENLIEEVSALRRNQTEPDDECTHAIRESESVLGDRQGYYRTGQGEDEHYWVRYKWTKGEWADHYVMGGHATLERAIMSCNHEVSRVLRGLRTPMKDRPARKYT